MGARSRSICLAAIAAALACAGPASAQDFCAGSGAGCEATLSDAIAAASASPDTDNTITLSGAVDGGGAAANTGSNHIAIAGDGRTTTHVSFAGVTTSPLIDLTAAGVTISGVTIEMPAGSGQTAVRLSGGASADRIAVSGGAGTGVALAGGSIANSLVELGPAATGISAAGGTNSATGVTLIGGGIGVDVSSSGGNGSVTTMSIDDSIIGGFTTAVRSTESGASVVALTEGNLDTESDDDLATPAIVTGTRTAADPKFADAAGHDYRLLHDSPAIDAGAIGSGGSDIDGGIRFVGGRRDLGAFEYQAQPPVAGAGVTPATANTGDAVTFTGSGTDPDPGDTLAYLWSIDGAHFPSKDVTTSFATAGTHTGTLTVTDPTGQSDTKTVTVTITKPPASTPPATQPREDPPAAVETETPAPTPAGPALRPGICLNLFNGTPGADRLTGSAFGDVLIGFAGNDQLAGLGGGDCVLGDQGDDRLDGGDGNDDVRGEAGNDVVRGGAGDDALTGGPGRDSLDGGAGNDTLDGGPGPDRFRAGAGNDVINSADGHAETVNCGPGRDSVTADRTDKLVGCETQKLRGRKR